MKPIPFIVTWVTHNSRVSERMIEYGVKKGKGIWLKSGDEIQITSTIARIVIEDHLKVLAYNICGDHVHMVLICHSSELSKIVGKLKAASAKEFHITKGLTPQNKGPHPLAPSQKKGGKKYHSLWAQKFHRRAIQNESYLHNAIHYVRFNRYKHNLYDDPELRHIIQTMICTEEEGLRMM